MRRTCGKVQARNGKRRTGKALKSLLVVVSVGVVLLCWHVEASSRSSPRQSRRVSSRRKRKRKRRTAPDPHDVSSSSPSFAPLIFTEDEREEDILSALARLETEGDDEKEAMKQKPTVKKAKRIVKKAMSGSRVEHKLKQEEAATKASVATSTTLAPANFRLQVDRIHASEGDGADSY